MPELQFKGKEFLYNHHLTVPFRPLEMHADKGIGEAQLVGNLIIHGDNLHALKALLPVYAGKDGLLAVCIGHRDQGRATGGKPELLALLSDKFDPTPTRSGALGMEEEAFDFTAALVLFGELDAKLSALIGGAEK